VIVSEKEVLPALLLYSLVGVIYPGQFKNIKEKDLGLCNKIEYSSMVFTFLYQNAELPI
jgi:hypothetical protein